MSRTLLVPICWASLMLPCVGKLRRGTAGVGSALAAASDFDCLYSADTKVLDACKQLAKAPKLGAKVLSSSLSQGLLYAVDSLLNRAHKREVYRHSTQACMAAQLMACFPSLLISATGLGSRVSCLSNTASRKLAAKSPRWIPSIQCNPYRGT